MTLVPSWSRFVPRSGAWMHVVRCGLGFSLLATVVWLLWIFGATAQLDGVIGLCGLLLALAFGLWCFGLVQRSNRPRMTLATGAFVLLLGVAGLNGVSARLDQAAASGEPTGDASLPHLARLDERGRARTPSPPAPPSSSGSPRTGASPAR